MLSFLNSKIFVAAALVGAMAHAAATTVQSAQSERALQTSYDDASSYDGGYYYYYYYGDGESEGYYGYGEADDGGYAYYYYYYEDDGEADDVASGNDEGGYYDYYYYYAYDEVQNEEGYDDDEVQNVDYSPLEEGRYPFSAGDASAHASSLPEDDNGAWPLEAAEVAPSPYGMGPCPSTCVAVENSRMGTCDLWVLQGFDCSELELFYGCDCTACSRCQMSQQERQQPAGGAGAAASSSSQGAAGGAATTASAATFLTDPAVLMSAGAAAFIVVGVGILVTWGLGRQAESEAVVALRLGRDAKHNKAMEMRPFVADDGDEGEHGESDEEEGDYFEAEPHITT